MTLPELILLAESAGFYDITDMRSKEALGCLEYFASKVAAQAKKEEREECAEVCEDQSGKWGSWFVAKGDKFDRGLAVGAQDCAKLIRERGEQ